jgi:hypothetical protein
MSAIPIYEERLNVNYLLISGVLLWALAVGLVPGIILGRLWWLTALYIALTIGIIVSFFQMRVELFKENLVIRFGLFYRKVVEIEGIQACSAYKIPHPIRTYGGWGIRKGRDGTFALTQAFINGGVKLDTREKTFVISSRRPEAFSSAINSIER